MPRFQLLPAQPTPDSCNTSTSDHHAPRNGRGSKSEVLEKPNSEIGISPSLQGSAGKQCPAASHPWKPEPVFHDASSFPAKVSQLLLAMKMHLWERMADICCTKLISQRFFKHPGQSAGPDPTSAVDTTAMYIFIGDRNSNRISGPILN